MIAFRNAFEGLWTLDGHLRVVALILLVQLLRDLAQTNVESALLGRVGVRLGDALRRVAVRRVPAIAHAIGLINHILKSIHLSPAVIFGSQSRRCILLVAMPPL